MLVLAVAASWWLSRTDSRAPASVATAAPEVPLGYYLRDARLLGTDEQGMHLYTVAAAEIRRQRDDAPIELFDVSIGYTPGSSIPWRLTSERGAVSADLTEILLFGHVTAVNEERAIVVRTDHLMLDTVAQVAHNDAPVEVEFPSGRLHSVGVTASMKERFLRLESQIHGTITLDP